LPAGVALKSKEVKLLYDTHEIYPEVISYAPWYIRNYLKYIEKNLIKFADVTFAVSPQIKAWIKKEYKVTNVVVLPNAEIWKKASPMNSGLEKYFRNRIIFLYQGGFHSGRGLEELMDYWKDIDSSKAVLVLRGPKNQSFLSLNATSKQMIDSKRIVFAEKVKENELISAAMEADVGIIPYDGKNLNNRYSCPNKLSQYMHAGLAILHSDLSYVNSLVNKYKCGLSYQVDNKITFVNSVNKMIHNPNLLRSMKVNSYESGRKSFNWEANEKLYLKYV
jgi:glycosyltransferase involved in cell wall biosynthesis